MSRDKGQVRQFRRLMLRSEFQSLFWHAILTRKRETKFSLKALADSLGIHKSYISRSFSSPPNWTIDKLADMADVLDMDLILEARDRHSGAIYTSSGNKMAPRTGAVPPSRHPDGGISTVSDLQFGDQTSVVTVSA